MEQLVKYDNAMNTVQFTGFSAVNQDIFMTLVAKLRDKHDETITLDFSTIRAMIDYPKTKNNTLFIKDLRAMNKKMLDLKCSFEGNGVVVDFVLFPTFKIDTNTNKLTVRVNPDFAWILNQFQGYTEFELKQFAKLESKYSKSLYRILKQFKSTGWFKGDLDEIRKILDIPISYKNRDIAEKVIKPSVEELKKHFHDLSFKAYTLPKRGAPTGGYEFKWTPDNRIKGQMTLYDTTTQQFKTVKKKNKFTDMEQKQNYNLDELEDKLLSN